MPVILSDADAHLVLRLLKSVSIPRDASHLTGLLEQGLSARAPLLSIIHQAASPMDAYLSPTSLPSGQPSVEKPPVFLTNHSRSDSPYAKHDHDHESVSKSPVITNAGNAFEPAPLSEGSSWDVCGGLGRRRQRSESGSPRRRQRMRRESPNSLALVSASLGLLRQGTHKFILDSIRIFRRSRCTSYGWQCLAFNDVHRPRGPRV